MKGLDATVVRGGMVGLAVKVGSTLLTLALAVLLARALGPAGYGVYTYAFALVSLLAVPAHFGLPSLVLRETAAALVDEAWSRMRGLWHLAGLVTLVLSLALAGTAAAAAWWFADSFSSEALRTFYWALLLVPLVALGNLPAAALRGLGRIAIGLVSEHVARIGLLVMLVFAVSALPRAELTAAVAMSLHVLAAALTLALTAWLLRRNRPHAVAAPGDRRYETSRWLHSAMPLAFTAGMLIINTKADVLMLGVFADAESVGIYQVAASGAHLVTVGLAAVGLAMAPHFATLHAQQNHGELQRLVSHSGRMMLLLALPAAALLMVFGVGLIAFVFGPEFAPAYAPLVILAVGQLVNAAFGAVGMLLNMTHHERATAHGLLVAAIANIVLNLILIPPFGIVGAAIATGGSLALWNVLLWRAALRRLSINTFALARVQV